MGDSGGLKMAVPWLAYRDHIFEMYASKTRPAQSLRNFWLP
jgi:hypothetical protein